MLDFLENLNTDRISLNQRDCALILMSLSIVGSGEYGECKWDIG